MLFHKKELATLLVLLLVAALALATSEESQTRTHKAMRAFDRTKTSSQQSETTTTAANEDQVVDEDDEEQDHYDENDGDDDEEEEETGSTAGPTTSATGNYVATTPKIVKSTKVLSRWVGCREEFIYYYSSCTWRWDFFLLVEFLFSVWAVLILFGRN